MYSYYNVIIYVENTSPTDKRIDIKVSCENEILVDDIFVYSQITPNYRMAFAHVPKGKHLIKVKSIGANIEKSQQFTFSRKRAYIIVEYQYRPIDGLNDEKIDSIAKSILN